MKLLTLNFQLLTLLALLLLSSCDAEEPGTGTLPGEPVEFIIPDYPAWQSPPAKGEYPEGGRGSETRTATDPTDALKTNWVKDDKLWIAMKEVDGSNDIIHTATATYTGDSWTTDLHWPIGVTRAIFDAYYIGNHEPDQEEAYADTDILYAGGYGTPENPVPLSFGHVTNRLTLTRRAGGEDLYLSGSGFEMVGITEDYQFEYIPLNNEYRLIPAGATTTFYLLCPGGERKVYKKEADDTYTSVGTLNLTTSDFSGYTFTIDLDAQGAITPEGMNEVQEQAKAKADFLAWAASPTTYFTLENDIDLTGEAWEPVNIFGITFDGQGHTITGLKVETTGGYDAGLFGNVVQCIIQNLHVEGKITSQSLCTGGIAGQIQHSTLTNVSFKGEITSTGNHTGGIAGAASNSRFTGCQYGGPSELKMLGYNEVGNIITP